MISAFKAHVFKGKLMDQGKKRGRPRKKPIENGEKNGKENN